MAPPPKKKLSAKEQREVQKQAKQKKLIMILAPVLLIAVAIQVPRLLGGGEEEATSTDTTTVETTESGAPAADGGQPAADPAAPAPAATVTGDPILDQALGVASPAVARLVEVSDSDPLAPVDETELVSFTTFLASDPFVQLVEPPPEEEEKDESEKESGGPEGSEPAAPGEPGGIDILAILEINGTSEVVKVGDAFPLDDPAFKLVSIDSEGSVTFGLVEGSFSSGIDTLDLEAGKSITLVSQPDGFRYTIRLVQLTEDAGAIEAPSS